METETTAVTAATDAPVTTAVQNAAEDVDSHTPETPAPPADNPTDATGESGLDELRETVNELARSFTALTDLVTDLAKNLSGDESPVSSVPWTHRGTRTRGDDE
jgi:hypothetical protein